MTTPTYEQQWQKITSAYLNNKLEPQRDCACFIGNLLNNTGGWSGCRTSNGDFTSTRVKIVETYSEYAIRVIQKESGGMYEVAEIMRMEQVFLRTANKGFQLIDDGFKWRYDEDCLFEAMTAALEVLRQIHEAKGDPTAKPITLNKRQLV